MRRFRRTIMRVAAAAIALRFSPSQREPGPPPIKFRRPKDGRPDLSGIWQALDTAHWDLQAHAAQASHVVALGRALNPRASA